MAEQNNQVARELNWFDAKELDPSSLNVRKLRSRRPNEELHTPFIRQPTPGTIGVHGTVQNSKINGICLPSPINQSTPALVTSSSQQSSSGFDTDQGEIIDKTIKQAAQPVNQMLLKTTIGNSTTNLTLSNSLQDRTLDR